MISRRLAGPVVLVALVVSFGALAAAVDSGYRDAATGPSTPDSTVTPLPPGAADPAGPSFSPFDGALSGLASVLGPVFEGPFLVAALAGTAVALGAVVLFAGGVPWGNGIEHVERRSAEGEADDANDEEERLEDLGQAAGEAADRIERGEGDNEVYRAYVEMTDLLALSNPEARTPAEFEQRATEAGMAPEDVRELTTLFAEVRYGGRDPDAREERAVAVLRRIENAYAGDGSDG